MNIFEDLIDELKEDNLLEETVIKINSAKNSPIDSEKSVKNENTVPDIKTDEEKIIEIDNTNILTDFVSVSDEEANSILEKDYGISDKTYEINPPEVSAIPAGKFELEANQTIPINDSSREAEFFRLRANNEVTFLQMVEHVFAGVERDQMKVVPNPYDVLKVKKVLHTFLQVSKEKSGNEQAQAEFQLLQETENWFSTLTHRDKRISVNHLRRYCETARPPLSAPAMISLARFYRNSPYSEQVRGKFDLIITRLFSRDIKNERREIAFGTDELVTHIKELYAEWSSIPLYSSEDDSEILLIALKFEDFINEATVADSFDELIKTNFFNRLRLFKKETCENFFSPLVVAANIQANIKIGNRYVELLDKEKSNKSLCEDKYGFLHDQSISDATGKTFQLVELLNRKAEKPEPVKLSPEKRKEIKAETKSVRDSKKEAKPANENKTGTEIKTVNDKSKPEAEAIQIKEGKAAKHYFGINSWLLTAMIFTIIASVGILVWSGGSNSEAAESAAAAKNVNLENSSLRESIKTASVKGEVFTATVLPAWNNLPADKKEELLKKIMSIGSDKGFKKVQLFNDQSKIVGFASPEKVEVYNQ